MFKWLLDNSLRNRLLVIIASLVLMGYGAFTLTQTPVDVFPDLNKPTVTIMTEAGGMAAEGSTGASLEAWSRRASN